MIAWRLARAVDRQTAFSGYGSFKYGSRWSSPGKYAVYLSRSLATAALEILVHAGSPRSIPLDELAIKVLIPNDLPMDRIGLDQLPRDWHRPDHPACRRIGDVWLAGRRTAILDVPSAVVSEERDLIINPLHGDFTRIDVSDPGVPFRWDPRLISFLVA